MFCVNCFYPKTNVTNSRPHKKQPLIWRRRHCPACGAVFTTTEQPSVAHNQAVHAPDGTTTPFNLGRLILSVARAFQHDPTQAKTVSLELARTVEARLATDVERLTPDEIAAVTHLVLKHFDELAAMQYAAQHQLLTSTKRRPGRPGLRERERPTGGSPSL